MAVDNIARALAAKALGQSAPDVTKNYVDTELAKKFDKIGGTITGDVAIQGDLTVSGTTTTEYEKQLLVEDNVIATNANKVDLQTLLSGLAINKNPNATYGIMYDPVDDTVKFGEGTLDENNKFVFKEGEGHPLAIRADSGTFTDAHLVKWDAASMSFVDAGVSVNDFSKKISVLDLSYGEQTLTYDTADGITLNGQARITYEDNTTEDIVKNIEIPIVPEKGLKMDATTDNQKASIQIDPEHSVYMETTPTAENAIPVYAKSSKSWINLPATPSATASSMVARDAGGRAQFGTPVNDADAATKKFVEDSRSTIGVASDANPPALSKIVYMAEADIPDNPEVGFEYACEDLIGFGDLDAELQTKIDTAVTHTELNNAITAEGPASTVVVLNVPENAENGTLTVGELAALTASDNASIMLNHKKYYLEGKGHQEGYLTYTHSGYENHMHSLESITITISTRGWVLNVTDIPDTGIPVWRTDAPATAAEKNRIQFTKVTIHTTDTSNFPGMNGRYAVVPGFSDDGFNYGTVVCSQADPAYEFPFIGSITSVMASGTFVRPDTAPTYVSTVNPDVTFSYEYLW